MKTHPAPLPVVMAAAIVFLDRSLRVFFGTSHAERKEQAVVDSDREHGDDVFSRRHNKSLDEG